MVKQTKSMISNGEETSKRIIQSEFKASTVLEADARHDASAISHGASPFVKVVGTPISELIPNLCIYFPISAPPTRSTRPLPLTKPPTAIAAQPTILCSVQSKKT
ncbi:unnamed protein product [Mortierella alpina]